MTTKITKNNVLITFNCAACKVDSANGSGMQGMHLRNWLMTRKSEVLIGQNPFLSDFYPKIYDYSPDKYE